MSQIAIIILTYNEELNLAHCLASVKALTDEIYVVDSGSSDQTVTIAKEFGAYVVFNSFINQAQQFNWALDNLPLKAEWILRLDADEQLLPELVTEISETLSAAPANVNGYFMNRRMIFLKRWIRYGGYYPIYILRLMRYGKAYCEPVEMDEQILLREGEAAYLKHDFIHDDHKGVRDWMLKHIGYAERQVRTLKKLQVEQGTDAISPNLFGNQTERKRWLKRYVFGRTPLVLRAIFFFFYRYFLRLGILDGVPGLIYHFLHGFWFPFYTDALIYEANLNNP